MSAPGEATPRARGFTLIEILVVLALIALLTGLAALSAGAAGSPVEREARRLASTLRLAVDESRLQGRVLGLRFDREGYTYLELLPGAPDENPGFDFFWQPSARTGALAPRSWPPPMTAELRINGRLVSQESQGSSRAPQVVLLPVGELTPFSLRLTGSGEAEAVLRIGSAGQLEIQTP